MAQRLRRSVTDPVRNAVPFLVITVVWVVIMLAIYGVFLVTKPSGAAYEPWVYVSVFAIPGVGFLGQILQQALVGGRE